MNYAFHLPTKFILAAVALDLIFGDPQWLPHPVVLIGRFVAWGDSRFHSGVPTRDLVTGAMLAVGTVTLTATVSWIVIAASQALDWRVGALVATLAAWTTLAIRGLNDAAAAVERALRCNDEDLARHEIRSLVGRDPEALDREGLIAAAIESVAENSSDGIIAPLVFLFAGGPVAALAYKAISTLDSMIGYKTERYLYFGKCAARLDDIANFVPARLAAFSIAAAVITSGRTLDSLRVCFADARKHESPNAGYPEAAMAGALGVRLGGDAYYGGELERRPAFGHAEVPLDLAALRTSRTVLWTATVLALALGVVLRSIAVAR